MLTYTSHANGNPTLNSTNILNRDQKKKMYGIVIIVKVEEIRQVRRAISKGETHTVVGFRVVFVLLIKAHFQDHENCFIKGRVTIGFGPQEAQSQTSCCRDLRVQPVPTLTRLLLVALWANIDVPSKVIKTMKSAILASLVASAAAFAPASTNGMSFVVGFGVV